MPRLPHPTPDELRRDPLPLRGRTALVTGASRRGGIGHAVARRLAAYGASVYLHHHVPHDAAMPWGADRTEDVVASVRAALGDPEATVVAGPGDLSDPAAPGELLATAAEALGGRLDVLVANHALSGSDGTLDTVDAAMLDAHWQVDTRSVLLLVQAFARHRAALPARTPGGRVVMMTSGQDIAGGMPGEIAYALQKGALASITRSLSTALADHAVTVNAVNPGPVDTDYMTGEDYDAIAALFPAGRWGMPDDPARLVAWLATDEAEWVTGQVIDSEGGFRR
ncbi:SDR family oxidoreductase [Streptomyces rochei]|uniref:SDR family oxidoreductase n=1 Tax=Streptomyces plicatus TaxID=1922 RepID=A0ABW1XU25_STRPL|nr:MULTISPECIES: SDR family oxidoreductase [Streptomyces]RIH60979.1 SDR family oxidoreductase [Streptomyces sp. SHP22-7]GGY62467.1 3-ketoacyl-ACP reductase [Streptomyces geysiriensis]MBJ6618563.1 SDR family oxidoreductase [Streptomyces sp. DHE17-7]MBU8548467.1 SDR family oxidoreductase [Streptomyces sp. Osf17]MBU8555243.1 SDR family oxidoreductase [Streptomyces sp. Babs14]